MSQQPSTCSASRGHAATMNRVYRRQRHVYDLTRKYYLFGRDTMLDRLDIPEGGRVLEIGCGTGRNLVAAARRTPHALFYGFDIFAEMLDQARANVRRSQAAPRIFLTQGDAENFDARRHFRVEGFDRAFMSYTVSMIPGWQQAISHALPPAEAIRQLAPRRLRPHEPLALLCPHRHAPLAGSLSRRPARYAARHAGQDGCRCGPSCQP